MKALKPADALARKAQDLIASWLMQSQLAKHEATLLAEHEASHIKSHY